MPKGLSETQKKILKAIDQFNETKPENINLNHVNDLVKNILFPELYFAYSGYGCLAVNYGKDQKRKNNARVVISKSIKRLFERGLIETFRVPIKGFNYNTSLVRLTPKAKLLVNELTPVEFINQYEYEGEITLMVNEVTGRYFVNQYKKPPTKTTLTNTTTVINMHGNNRNYDVYIGRENGRLSLNRSKWHNPFKVGRDGTQQEVVELYRQYITTGSGKHLLNDLHELKGKKLGCWCHPLPCHGDILIKLIENEG